MHDYYPVEQLERAVKMVLVHLHEYESVYAACQAIGPKVELGAESLCRWTLQAQFAASQRRGATNEQRQIKDLEREVQDLRDALAIGVGLVSPQLRRMDSRVSVCHTLDDVHAHRIIKSDRSQLSERHLETDGVSVPTIRLTRYAALGKLVCYSFTPSIARTPKPITLQSIRRDRGSGRGIRTEPTHSTINIW